MNTGTLRQVANALDKKYGTVRHYSVRYKDTFPAPTQYGDDGRGILWDIDDIEEWWRQHDNNKRQGGAPKEGGKARAELGHKFRKIRAQLECTECNKKFYAGETVYEVRNDNDLSILCEECNDLRESNSTGQDEIA